MNGLELDTLFPALTSLVQLFLKLNSDGYEAVQVVGLLKTE